MAQIHKTSGFDGGILHTPTTCHLNMGVIMNVKKIKAVKEAIAMMNSVSGTIAQTILSVNLTSTDAPLITGKFNRRAALAAELERVLKTLEAEQAINDPRTDDEGNDPREWCGNDIEAAHAEALEYNAMRHVSKMTMPAVMDAAHTKALDIDYCVEAVKEGGGYLGGYVVQNKDASFQILRERTTTGNPLKATYFSEEDYQQGRMKQFCFNGEIPVRLGAAVLAVAELAK